MPSQLKYHIEWLYTAILFIKDSLIKESSMNDETTSDATIAKRYSGCRDICDNLRTQSGMWW
jgi:hypothetical protein